MYEATSPLPLIKSSKKAGRQTHLHKQSKFLKRIPAVVNPQYLTTIYLYNNELTKIEGLEACANLVCLYLQENQIKLIENMNKLKKLQKLFLGHNKIAVIENLEDNILLEELHVEKQNVKKCDSMCFDPRSIFALSASLRVLNVTGNNLRSFYSLMPLSAMRVLHAGRNKVTEVHDILETIQFWYSLYEATFTGNPVTKKHRYRELLISNTSKLTLLDGKQISPTTRTFIHNFEAEKKNKLEGAVNLSDTYPDLPRNYPTALQQAVSASIIKTGLSDMKLTSSHIPWKQLPRREAVRVRRRRRTASPVQSKTLFPMNL